jgi:hypothetical protein
MMGKMRNAEFSIVCDQEILTLITLDAGAIIARLVVKKIKFYGFDFSDVKTSLTEYEFLTQVDADFAGKLKKMKP